MFFEAEVCFLFICHKERTKLKIYFKIPCKKKTAISSSGDYEEPV